jgi:hypothetical protein
LQAAGSEGFDFREDGLVVVLVEFVGQDLNFRILSQ